eukprot:IDg17444t1
MSSSHIRAMRAERGQAAAALPPVARQRGTRERCKRSVREGREKKHATRAAREVARVQNSASSRAQPDGALHMRFACASLRRAVHSGAISRTRDTRCAPHSRMLP